MAAKNLKRYTVGEEVFNSVSHGVSALLAVIGCTVMVTLSACFGTGWLWFRPLCSGCP